MRGLLLLVLVVFATVLSAAPAQAATSSEAERCGAPRVNDPRTPAPSGDSIPPENDWDCDEIPNGIDNCPTIRNADQSDVDRDGFGDRCDDDADNDSTPNAQDPCPLDVGLDPAICAKDTDGDGHTDRTDNCRRIPNPDQLDTDADLYGDICDSDDDDDYDLDHVDNCPLTPNPDQADADGDGIGDACDSSTILPPTIDPGPAVIADKQAPTLSLRTLRAQYRSDTVGGMPLWVRCSEACAITATVTLSAREARRLGLGRKALVVAAGDAAVDDAGSTYVFFDVTKTAARKLFKKGTVSATLELRATDAAGNSAAPMRRALKLKP